MAKMHGFEAGDWNTAKEEMRQTLIARARAKSTIPYSELVQQIHAITFEPDSFALSAMLGEISAEENAADRGMLTVIVVHKDGDQQPGPGFFELARSLGRDTSDKCRCWVAELNMVYRVWENA